MRQSLPSLGRYLSFLFFFIIIIKCAYSQHVEMDSFPRAKQLYPRDLSTNKARVAIQGRLVATSTFENVRIRIWRDFNKNNNYDDDGLPVVDSILPLDAGFNFKYIYFHEAKTFNYRYRLEGRRFGVGYWDWLRNTQNSTVVADDVVAGDAYIINGQSNAEARRRPEMTTFFNSVDSVFVRVLGDGNITLPLDDQWRNGSGSVAWNQDGNVGMWGMRLAQMIIQKYDVPVCIFNGSYFSEDIDYFLPSFTGNGNTLTNNNYTRLYDRVRRAGMLDKIRAIFWYQGENDAYPLNASPVPGKTKEQYKSLFDQLYQRWKQDFIGVNRVFLFQVRTGCFSGQTDAIRIQQAQFEIAKEKSDITLVSTSAIPQLVESVTPGQFCHFDYEIGYKVIGQRVFNLVDQLLYGNNIIVQNTRTPIPGMITFSGKDGITALANQITIDLQPSTDNFSFIGTEVDNLLLFRLTGGNYQLNGLAINGNKLTISFSALPGTQNNPTGISYYNYGGSTVNRGIINGNGIGLVAFDQLTIDLGVLPTDPLSLRINQNGTFNDIRWDVDGNEDFESYVVERSETGTNFTEIGSIQCNGRPGKISYSYLDSKPNSLKNYYRIHAIRRNGNGLYSQVVVVNNKLNTVPGITVFPNPAAERANVRLTLRNAGDGSITLFDVSGKTLSTRKLQFQKGTNTFSVGELLDHGAGVYIIKVQTATEIYQTKVIRVK
ncbi:T9SS type A sorting domain-containing protein [Flavihumibacter rivuli]|uniref:T9SS type A sorting domain-containing protein n=1 Tax=Flavihumibacter rivuli TaxID=2838156 RepID=UPI001BDF3F9F|nr:T9SS type A sorting domain-containing protein [Flavihumibacter rivuli]ULQ57957.1 T9SS type A sorting domain-containing protein [Flavihumibacter rivuli]